MQQNIPLNSITYYLAVFSSTVLYYTYAYVRDSTANTHNERAVWYLDNRQMVKLSQIVLTLVLCTSVFSIIKALPPHFFSVPLYYYPLLVSFPLVAALYYGVNSPALRKYNLRDTGWLKSFIIGFVWAGAVSVYPVIFASLSHGITYELSLFKVLLFIKNCMFITVLCIMFDIKDYAADHNKQLKTFVVRVGLRKTIFYILIPLCSIGLGTFLIYAFVHQFSWWRISCNTLPFTLLIMVAYSMYQRKSILYYLAVIDGLMFVKALCGIMSVIKW